MPASTTTARAAGPAELYKRPDQHLSVVHVLFMLGVHAGAIASLAWFSWAGLVACLVLYVLTGIGITVGYHRLLAHRSFRAPRWLERTAATLGCLAMQGGPLRWVADHREHHFHSDASGDPHDIGRGLFFAHMGWLFLLYPREYDEARILDRSRDLARDPYLRWLERYHWIPGAGLGVGLLAGGDASLFLWGFCTRLVVLYHATWLVNSAAHVWGYRTFPQATGTNNWLVALLAFGEGWHNNHHAWPASARQGLRAWEIDPSWHVIAALHRLGLAHDVRSARLAPEAEGGAVMYRV